MLAIELYSLASGREDMVGGMSQVNVENVIESTRSAVKGSGTRVMVLALE